MRKIVGAEVFYGLIFQFTRDIQRLPSSLDEILFQDKFGWQSLISLHSVSRNSVERETLLYNFIQD